MLRDAWVIARADLALMLRQREILLWVVAMPLLFFYFIGTVTQGFGRPPSDRPDPLVLRVTDRDAGLIVDALTRRLEAERYAVHVVATDDVWQAAPRRIRFEWPAGEAATLTDAVLAGQPVRVVLGAGDDPLRANHDTVRVARAVYGLVGDLAVLRAEGVPPSADALAAVAARSRALRISVSSAGRRVEPPSGFAQAIPGTLVMFTMLVLLTGGAILLVIERETGLLRRLAATPITPAALIAGKWAARMALAIVQILVAMAFGTWVFGMRWGDALPMVGVVLVVWAAFNASLALLLGNLARTQAQTVGIGVLSTMVLAALGGCWWPIEVAPRWMQTLATLLPTGWCMGALHKLVNFGEPAAAALPHVGALAVAAAVTALAGVRTFRYQ